MLQMIDVNRQLARISSAAGKWRDRVQSSLANEGVTIVTLRVRLERGELRRINNLLEEEESEESAAMSRMARQRFNLSEQIGQVSGPLTRYLNRLHMAMEARAVTTHLLRAKVEGGRIFRVYTQIDEDEILEAVGVAAPKNTASTTYNT